MRAMREELEREENARQHEFEMTSRTSIETLKMARRYLQSLPS